MQRLKKPKRHFRGHFLWAVLEAINRPPNNATYKLLSDSPHLTFTQHFGIPTVFINNSAKFYTRKNICNNCSQLATSQWSVFN